MWDEVAARKANPKAAEEAFRLKVLAFGLRYFRHRLEHDPSRFHVELCAELDRIVASADSEADAYAAPRGNAKSTWITLIFVIYCIVYDLKRYIVPITNESSLAVELVEDIAHELETNEDLKRDFPHATGRGPVWKKGIGILVTVNDIKVQGFGSGKKVRGRKHRQHRPDLVIGDDLENDEQCRSREQRVKFRNWWNKAVMKLRGPGKKFDVLVAGTVLHFDSFLANLMNADKSPGWRRWLYKSVISWSERADLWQVWEGLYTDWRKSDDDRQRAALEFYEANQVEMLKGTKVLWEEGEPYYELMKLRVDDGPAAFDSEKQNQPIDPETCFFKEEWIQQFDEIRDEKGHTYLAPDKGETIALADCDIFGSLDPSMGKKSKGRDPSALISIAAYPAKRLKQGAYREYWVIDGEVARRHPHELLERVCARHLDRGYRRFGVEAIQFQELFADDLKKKLLEDPRLAGLNVIKLTPNTDKALRIKRLEPFIYSGRLKFSRKLSELLRQIRFYTDPPQDHDDGPDAVEQCLETIGAISWKILSSNSNASAEAEVKEQAKSADQRQLEAAIPELVRKTPTSTESGAKATCGNCRHRLVKTVGEEERLYCGLRDSMRVKAEMDACPHWRGALVKEKPKPQDPEASS